MERTKRKRLAEYGVRRTASSQYSKPGSFTNNLTAGEESKEEVVFSLCAT